MRDRSGRGTLGIAGRGEEARKKNRSGVCSRDGEDGSRILEKGVCTHKQSCSTRTLNKIRISCVKLHKQQSCDRLVASSVHASQAQECRPLICLSKVHTRSTVGAHRIHSSIESRDHFMGFTTLKSAVSLVTTSCWMRCCALLLRDRP